MKERIPWSGALRPCCYLRGVPGLTAIRVRSPALLHSHALTLLTPVAASLVQEVERAGAAALKKAAAANATVDKAEAASAETEDALVRLAFGRVGSVGGTVAGRVWHLRILQLLTGWTDSQN